LTSDCFSARSESVGKYCQKLLMGSAVSHMGSSTTPSATILASEINFTVKDLLSDCEKIGKTESKMNTTAERALSIVFELAGEANLHF